MLAHTIPAAAAASAPRAKPLSQAVVMSGGFSDIGGAGALEVELAPEVVEGAGGAWSSL